MRYPRLSVTRYVFEAEVELKGTRGGVAFRWSEFREGAIWFAIDDGVDNELKYMVWKARADGGSDGEAKGTWKREKPFQLVRKLRGAVERHPQSVVELFLLELAGHSLVHRVPKPLGVRDRTVLRHLLAPGPLHRVIDIALGWCKRRLTTAVCNQAPCPALITGWIR